MSALLPHGVYEISNVAGPDKVMDLSGYDGRSVNCYGWHGNENQQWELTPLGAGYSIRCLWRKGQSGYVTIDSDVGLLEGGRGRLIACEYPVSWVLEAATGWGPGVWTIAWPNSSLVLEQPGDDSASYAIQLSDCSPMLPTKMWRLMKRNDVPLPTMQQTVVEQKPKSEPRLRAPERVDREPSVATTANTVIDAVAGKLSITTTTTTTATTVTVVERLGSTDGERLGIWELVNGHGSKEHGNVKEN